MRIRKRKAAILCLELLESEGFLRYAMPDFNRKEWIRHALGGDPLLEECGRVFAVDAEDLFERGPAIFLEEMASFMAAIGCAIRFEEIKVPHQRTTLRLNERHYLLEDSQEAQEEYGWGAALVRLAEALDSCLRESGVSERCYYTGLGNDALLCFLSLTMAETLTTLFEVTNSECELHLADSTAPKYPPKNAFV